MEKRYKNPIKKCAVALRGTNEVFKIEDYPLWLKSGDKNDIIIFEDCNESELNDKYLYWEHTVNYEKYVIREACKSKVKLRGPRK